MRLGSRANMTAQPSIASSVMAVSRLSAARGCERLVAASRPKMPALVL